MAKHHTKDKTDPVTEATMTKNADGQKRTELFVSDDEEATVKPKNKCRVVEYDSESDELSNAKPQPKDTDEEVSDYEEDEEIEAPTVKKEKLRAKPLYKRVASKGLTRHSRPQYTETVCSIRASSPKGEESVEREGT
jgi:hypothetical protein